MDTTTGAPTVGTAAPPRPAGLVGLVAPALSSGHGLLTAPLDPATWRAVAQVTLGWCWLLVGGVLALSWTATALGLVAAFGVGLPLLAAGLLAATGFARLERSRLAAQTGALLPAPTYRRAPRTGWWRWSTWWSVLADGRRWAHLTYAMLGAVVQTAAFVVVVGGAGAGVAALAFPAYGTAAAITSGSGHTSPVLAAGVVLLGLVTLWLVAVLAQVSSLTQVLLARALLGPGARDEVREARAVADAAQDDAEHARARADELTATRSAAVAAADAERRRIERDLHDGAQQRLVALGVELGAARRRVARDPDAAADAIGHAHQEVKETLAELRDLVRGIHPAVLTDRGLDAALSALAARSPVPVRVHVPDPAGLARATPAAQAAAYFVVAEALTNTAKHAGAQHVVVEAALAEDDDGCRLRVVVTDDGAGGADASPGGGLDGLRSRVAALDGTFTLDSPADRGTRLTVEVPCAS